MYVAFSQPIQFNEIEWNSHSPNKKTTNEKKSIPFSVAQKLATQLVKCLHFLRSVNRRCLWIFSTVKLECRTIYISKKKNNNKKNCVQQSKQKQSEARKIVKTNQIPWDYPFFAISVRAFVNRYGNEANLFIVEKRKTKSKTIKKNLLQIIGSA